MQTVLHTSRFNLSLSPRINHQPFSSTAKIPCCEIPILPLSSSHSPISGVCRAGGQVAELFPVTCPGIVVREAGIQDCWEVAETHCSSFFPGYSFPLDLLLRFDRVIGMLFGFSAPKGCKRTCLVAVIGRSGGSFFSGSDDVGIGNLFVNKGYVAGVLTLDTVAKFLPRKGPLRKRRKGIAYISNVAVREELRGKGIAKRVVAKAEAKAKSWGCRAIALHCDLNNTGAVQLYVSRGFKSVKVPEGANWPKPKASADVRFNFMMKLL
ncbi:hypothetical protein ABFS82_06G168000 [Erythranthe guttata]|uniref:N-acetyltransferase domain-containing protein n=1 Tax=Erythranthe guttata TaxID=4155 RepID=A0A022RI20_ERYGU|nr:PREDICTED: uncharacterized protein LOC105955698 [Erythranthe guttata]EYU39841.1 hypothetical protein MIMGU_mgv1a011978mg [Erythranthe guttata]|eukprot:XP_012834936.1 PREDICTED: uncharacterized protein LOC105955698 [Erythranthe guttata]